VKKLKKKKDSAIICHIILCAMNFILKLQSKTVRSIAKKTFLCAMNFCFDILKMILFCNFQETLEEIFCACNASDLLIFIL
jgi:hypothetical protein